MIEPGFNAALLAILVWLDDICHGIERCGQKTCMKVATSRFRWPGNPWLASCENHKWWATHLAEVMGFALQTEELPRRLANELDHVQQLRFAHLDLDP